MSKLNLLTLMFGIFCSLCVGQTNLVPNGSFEIYDTCPNTTYQIYLAKGWMQTQESPDLFATCAASTNVNVPYALPGYQMPADSNNFAGFMSYFDTLKASQEIGGIQLIDSTKIGHKYTASFKINLAGWGGNSMACSHQGLRLTTKLIPPYNNSSPTPTNAIANNFAHVFSTKIMTDTVRWETINGTFTADSNYRYLYFGIFFSYSTVSKTHLYGYPAAAYYYIDDIKLTEIKDSIQHPNPNDSLSTSLASHQLLKKPVIFPNPSKGEIRLVGIDDIYSYRISSFTGNHLLFGTIQKDQPIDVRSLESGIYLIELKNSVGRHFKDRLIIE